MGKINPHRGKCTKDAKMAINPMGQAEWQLKSTIEAKSTKGAKMAISPDPWPFNRQKGTPKRLRFDHLPGHLIAKRTKWSSLKM